MVQMLTVDDVAELLRVTARWVYDQARAGRITSVKMEGKLRFHPDDVEDYIESRTQKARTKIEATEAGAPHGPLRRGSRRV